MISFSILNDSLTLAPISCALSNSKEDICSRSGIVPHDWGWQMDIWQSDPDPIPAPRPGLTQLSPITFTCKISLTRPDYSSDLTRNFSPDMTRPDLTLPNSLLMESDEVGKSEGSPDSLLDSPIRSREDSSRPQSGLGEQMSVILSRVFLLYFCSHPLAQLLVLCRDQNLLQ